VKFHGADLKKTISFLSFVSCKVDISFSASPTLCHDHMPLAPGLHLLTWHSAASTGQNLLFNSNKAILITLIVLKPHDIVQKSRNPQTPHLLSDLVPVSCRWYSLAAFDRATQPGYLNLYPDSRNENRMAKIQNDSPRAAFLVCFYRA
jgi:hypothetical protein